MRRLRDVQLYKDEKKEEINRILVHFRQRSGFDLARCHSIYLPVSFAAPSARNAHYEEGSVGLKRNHELDSGGRCVSQIVTSILFQLPPDPRSSARPQTVIFGTVARLALNIGW